MSHVTKANVVIDDYRKFQDKLAELGFVEITPEIQAQRMAAWHEPIVVLIERERGLDECQRCGGSRYVYVATEDCIEGSYTIGIYTNVESAKAACRKHAKSEVYDGLRCRVVEHEVEQ